MLWILAIIIILYTGSHFIFRKNETFLRVRKWIDLATIIITSILVISWVEIFHYSFLFIIYFFVSLGIIIYLISKLRKVEIKKEKAEETIKVLKDEEKVLEEEIEELKTEEIKTI